MAADKPFEPTPQRLERARRQGDLPRATEFVALAAFAGAVTATALVAAPLSSLARNLVTSATARDDVRWSVYAGFVVVALAPVAAAAASAVGAFVVVHGRVAVRAPTLKLERLDPFAGFKRLFSLQTVGGLLRAGAAALALGCAAVPVVRDVLETATARSSPQALADIALRSLTRLLGAGILAGFAVACGELLLERGQWRRRLRMTGAELKRELRQNEADPQLRGRRRRAHGLLIRGSLQRLREAAFVVANPTHVAVALEYRPPEVAVPRVLLRATGEGAALIKRRARELEIPVVENAPLARELFASTAAGSYIPRESYDAVARIVAALLHAGRAKR